MKAKEIAKVVNEKFSDEAYKKFCISDTPEQMTAKQEQFANAALSAIWSMVYKHLELWAMRKKGSTKLQVTPTEMRGLARSLEDISKSISKYLKIHWLDSEALEINLIDQVRNFFEAMTQEMKKQKSPEITSSKEEQSINV